MSKGKAHLLRNLIEALVINTSTCEIQILTTSKANIDTSPKSLEPFTGLNVRIRRVNDSIATKEIHDRWIITDWTSLSIGAGWDAILAGEAESNTTIFTYPKLAQDEDKKYDNMVDHYNWLSKDGQSRQIYP